MCFGDFPELFEVIKGPGLGQHEMDDHVVKVNQYPLARVIAFYPQRLATMFFCAGNHLIRHCSYVTVRVSGSHNKGIGQRILTAYVDDIDVDRFQVLEGGNDQFAKFFSCRDS